MCNPINWNFLASFSNKSGENCFYLFGCSSHSVCFFMKKTFLSFAKKFSSCAYFSPMQKERSSEHHTLLPRPCLSFPFPSLLELYILRQQAYCLTFILWASFFSRKEPRMVCLKSRRFVYVFKTRMNDSKTLECSNSCQKVRILLKKLGEIRKCLSYREKLIQGTDRFVRPTEMFEFPSIRVIKRSTVLLRMSVTSQFGLRQVIKEPMHILDNSSLCIDLIFMSQANLLIESGVQSSLIQIIITRLV